MILKACFAGLFLLFDGFDLFQSLNKIWNKSRHSIVIQFIGGNMKLLEDRILNDGNVLGENILKVDSF